jgi:hypothetical protein
MIEIHQRVAPRAKEVASRGRLGEGILKVSAVQPGYDGSMYFPGATGTFVRLTPAPVDGGPQP